MVKVDRQVRQMYLAYARALVDQRADLDAADDDGMDINLPIFSVGQVGRLADIHPQTLRQYDRLGLIVPRRTDGGARRYSLRDVDRLCQAQRLSQDESINLAGVTRILALAEENRQLRRQLRRSRRPAGSVVFAADSDGEVSEVERYEARSWRESSAVTRRSGSDGRRMPATISHSRSLVVWGVRRG